MAAFISDQDEGSVVMLNLLRFREVADYSRHPELAPPSPISGKMAYGLYSTHTLSILQRAGGEVLFQGRARSLLIGPTDEHWDSVLLVRYESAGAFLTLTRDREYLVGVGHRTAALSDSRLLPVFERGLSPA
jgi:uncharacterized protein (DUF1330 family)